MTSEQVESEAVELLGVPRSFVNIRYDEGDPYSSRPRREFQLRILTADGWLIVARATYCQADLLADLYRKCKAPGFAELLKKIQEWQAGREAVEA